MFNKLQPISPIHGQFPKQPIINKPRQMTQISHNRSNNKHHPHLNEISINRNYNNMINSFEKNTESIPIYVQGLSKQITSNNNSEQNTKTEKNEDKSIFKFNFKFNNKQQYPTLRKNINTILNCNLTIQELLTKKQQQRQHHIMKEKTNCNTHICTFKGNNNFSFQDNPYEQFIPSLSIINYKVNRFLSYNTTPLTTKENSLQESKTKEIHNNITNIIPNKVNIINVPTLLKDNKSFLYNKPTSHTMEEINKPSTLPKNSYNTMNLDSNTRNLPLIKPLISTINQTNSTFEEGIKEQQKKSSLAVINNKIKNVIYEPSPPNYYSSEYYYYIIHPENCGNLIKKCMSHRLKWKECHSILSENFNFKWKDCSTKIRFCDLEEPSIKKQIINHFEYHSSLSNKAKLFKNFFSYCESINQEVFAYIPFTIIINLNDQPSHSSYLEGFRTMFTNINDYIFEFSSIIDKVFSRNKTNYTTLFPSKEVKRGLKTNLMIPHTHFNGKNYWIVKAPNLNRGRGMQVFDSVQGVLKFIKSISIGECKVYSNNNNKYYSSIAIIQKYIERPLLYNKRKFDIRLWVLLTHKLQVFVFKEGHLKACSIEYDDNDITDPFIHFTNYSLQKHSKNFSKYEKGNEISFEIFQNFLGDKVNIKEDIFPKFKNIIDLTMRSVKYKINERNIKYCFEIFGYDFMMDEEYNVFLIEVNTNPGLEESSELIKTLIPRMVDDALRLTVDDVFVTNYSDEWIDNNKNQYKSNFHVEGYDDMENMWEFVSDLNNINQEVAMKDFVSPKNKKRKNKVNKNKQCNKG